MSTSSIPARPSTERRAARLLTIPAALLVVLATACGGEESQQTAVASQAEAAANSPAFCEDVAQRMGRPQPVERSGGGTVVVGAIAEMPGGMNAFVSADYVANQHQVFVNLMTLVQFDERYEYTPYLAESWQVSDDGTELTFRLRDDVFWHDGPVTTAYDVAFTFETATHPETGFPNGGMFAKYQSVEVVDSFTVRFAVEPHATMLDPWRTLVVMPEHLLGEVPPSELAQHPFGMVCPVGNGPFRFVEHRDNDQWVFTSNPEFPNELGGPPPVGRYVYRIVPEETTLLTELVSGGIDVFISPSPDNAQRIRSSDAARLLHYPFRQYAFVAWNGRRPQLADPRVRQAIAMASNRAEMVDGLLSGFGQVANSGIPPMHWAHDDQLAGAMPYDPEAARALLDEAGWSDRDGDGVRENAEGEPLELEILFNQGNQVRRQIAELMQSYLRQVGIDARPTVLEWAALLEAIMNPEARNFDGVVMGWLPDFTIDESDFFHSSKGGGPLAWAGMEDAEIDRLLDALGAAADDSEAQPLWEAYQRRIVELQPFTYLYFQERLDGVSNRLQGVHMDARGEWVGIGSWRLRDAAAAIAEQDG